MSRTCKGKLYNKESCNREIINDSGWCIFHYPNKTGELIKKFNEALVEEIKKQKEEHSEYIDFTGFNFPSKITFNENFQSLYCGDATFHERVDFTGPVSKTHPMLRDEFNYGMQIDGEAWFYGTRFLKGTNFQGTTFNGDAVFSFVEFGGTASFNEAKFKELAYFTKASFIDGGWFTYAEFNKIARFLDIKVGYTFDFSYAVIKNRFYICVENWLPYKEGLPFSTYSVNIYEMEVYDKGKIIISGNLGVYSEEIIAGISFINNEIKKVEFIDEKWLRLDKKRNSTYLARINKIWV